MKKWNVMLLVAEDTGRNLGCYGDAAAHTPAIDGLSREGARYTTACSTAPVCAPSRSALVLGKYQWSVGSHHMRSTLLKPPRLFTQELRDAGYYVNWSNKTDFNFEPPTAFADDRRDWFNDLAAGKLNDRPWFLYHNFHITHESQMWPEEWEKNVAPQLAASERCDPAAVPVPEYLPDTPKVRADIARHYDCLRLQDRQIARALDALDRSGQRDNTIVIYLSDHGRGLVREKRWCYDAGANLPLIIRWPGGIAPGTVADEPVSWVDIAPTLLSILNLPVPDDYQGRVFLGEHRTPGEREYAFSGRDRMDEAFDRVRTARNRRFRYIRNLFPQLPYAQRNHYMEKQQTTCEVRELGAAGKLNAAQGAWLAEAKPAEELYDCLADPDNVRNLAADTAYADTLTQMRAALDTFLEESGDKGRLPERELIAQGLVADRLEEYGARIEPLPPHLRIGPERTVLEMPETREA
ncbi:MAG: sulfatase [Opitutales bacterium]|nr:sulfatase [Opitutales bacterium]